MNRVTLMTVVVVLSVSLGCGSEEPTDESNTSAPSADAASGDGAPVTDPTRQSDSTGTEEADLPTEPSDTPQPMVRNPSCDPADPEGEGAKVPWEGFQRGDTLYTCNTCRNGLDDLQGRWRLVDFTTEDPDVVLTDQWQQTFTFDGNTWHQVARWVTDGVAQEASMSGWYWCSSKPEVGNETKVFIVTDLTPGDAFGYEPGYVFTTDLLNSTEGGDKFAFWFYEGFNTGDQVAEIYCRIGDDVATRSGDVKACAEPWAR